MKKKHLKIVGGLMLLGATVALAVMTGLELMEAQQALGQPDIPNALTVLP